MAIMMISQSVLGSLLVLIVSLLVVHPTPFVAAIVGVFYGEPNAQLQLDLSKCRDVASWFSYAFQHIDFNHLIINVATMAAYGIIAQFSMGQIGHPAPFVRQSLCILFVQASSVLGGAVGFGFERRWVRHVTSLVGASAAVYGTVAVQVGFLIRNRKSWRDHTFRMFCHANLLASALASAVGTEVYMSGQRNNTTSVGSHIGGFVFGMLAHGASMPAVGESEREWVDSFHSVASIVGLFGLLVAGVSVLRSLC
jgi:membrane associated rhomboid family serine protease